MNSHPGDDSPEPVWDSVLSHRPPEERRAIAGRFEAAGLSAERVRAVLADGGDRLYAAAAEGPPGWAERFGGTLAAALLAGEIGAQIGRAHV